MKFEYKKGSLILLSGIPGSGKSSFSRKYFPQEYIVSSDELRERYFGDEYKFIDDGSLGVGNFEANGDFIFEMMRRIVTERAREGLTTVVDAMNLRDSDRKSFIELGNWERVYTLTFDTELGRERNKARKEQGLRGYIPEKIVEKKILSFTPRTQLKENNILKAEEITSVEETFEKLSLSDENNILIFGDSHGIRDFYSHYKSLQIKYTKNGKLPLVLFVGDIVDRGPKSVDNLCFVMHEVKKGNARMILGNHDFKLLRNITTFLEKGVIEDFVEARYRTIKDFVELHKKDGVYDGDIEEIKGENFNLHRVKNFLESLPYYKVIASDTKNYIVTHGPALPPENLGNLKKTNCVFGSEQLMENLRVSSQEALENNINFIKAAKILTEKNQFSLVFGHVDLEDIIRQEGASRIISLEGEVDAGGVMKVLVLEKEGESVKETLETFASDVNYHRGQAETGEYGKFAQMETSLMFRKEYGDMTIFKYARKVFYKNLWLKNTPEINTLLLRARGIVFDRLGNVISYPFDKVFNHGEILRNIQNEIVTENTLENKTYQFVEKLNGFLGIISQDFYNRNGLLIHTSGSLEGPYIQYIKDFISEEHRIAMLKFFKTRGKHTLMFEVLHPDDPHIIPYSADQFGIYLIGCRDISTSSLDDMRLFSETELDTLASELGFARPAHFVESYEVFKNRISTEKIEGYMVRDIDTGKHILKIKFPYYLVTKFLSRMGADSWSLLFANPQKFIELKQVDEEFFPLIEYISSHREDFQGLDEIGKGEKIREYLGGVYG